MKPFKKKYSGKIVDVYDVMFDDFEAEILHHSGGVCIAATHDDKVFYFVEQFRYGVDKNLIEFPAGKIDPGESPETAAHRELREEIGFECNNLIPLGYVYPSPAYLDEKLFLYYASDLNFVGQDLDENEELRVFQKDLEWLKKGILENEITDSKTIALYVRLKHYLNK